MRNLVRRTLAAVVPVNVVLALTVLGAPAAGLAGCALDGSAAFSPGLKNASQNFSYSFSGSLTKCNGSPAGPATGTVTAGKAVSIAGVTYNEPKPTGNGGCASSTTNGLALVQWPDGKYTVISYRSSGVTAAIQLTGTVVSSMTLTAPGKPNKIVTTNRYAGYSFNGFVLFQPPDPTACNGGGVTSAGIHGVTALSVA